MRHFDCAVRLTTKVVPSVLRVRHATRNFSSTLSRFNEVEAQKPEADTSSISYLHDTQVLNSTIFRALSKLGFKNLTTVQSKTIEPMLKTDEDLITKAKTGTGKTLAFGIPIIEKILRKPTGHPGVRALIIAPTRDLAFQIRDELNKVAKVNEVVKQSKRNLRISTLVGGENRWGQIREFTNNRVGPPSIVVATPGRFIDVIREPEVAEAFSNLETFVLDEADRLLGDGFREDLVQITETLNGLRQESNLTDLKPLKTMLFSATMDKSILSFSKTILRPNFHFIDTVDPNEPETHEKITQSLILTDNIFESYVSAALFVQRESKSDRKFKAIIFLPTVKSVSYFYDVLAGYFREKNIRLPVHQLHGKLTQSTRDRAVRNFRNGFSGVLVASDVGARGMDFPNVTNVIQVGLPMDSTNYVHRVGRTARGGSTGKAVMILSKAESRFVKVLQKRNVTVSEKYEYEKVKEAEDEISEVSQKVFHKFSLDQVIESLAGFSKGVTNAYKLNMYEILEDLSNAYGRFSNDTTKLPHVSPRFATSVLGLNRRDAQEFFDLSYTQSPEQTDDRRDFDNAGPRRGGFEGRNNFRSSNRGGRSDFGNDRRYSNDRRDNDRGRRTNDRRDKSRSRY